jgi:hypothetical protein
MLPSTAIKPKSRSTILLVEVLSRSFCKIQKEKSSRPIYYSQASVAVSFDPPNLVLCLAKTQPTVKSTT